MTALPDAQDELASIAASLRAHLERCAESGAFGLPGAPADLVRAAAGPGLSEADLAEGPPRDGGAEPLSPSGRGAEQRAAPIARAVATASVGSREPLSAAERVVQLAMLKERVASCDACGLCRERKQAVFSRGTGTSGLCFVGEGPGADEDEQGEPFVGKAGQLLDRMIEAMGLSRDEVYVCNVVKCRPPKNRKPEPDEMAACRPHLALQLELLEPKVIVALGATAVEGLLGIAGGITRLRGNWRLYKGKVPVMPTFHPAYLLRTPEAKRDVWNDLQEVVRHMGRTLPARK